MRNWKKRIPAMVLAVLLALSVFLPGCSRQTSDEQEGTAAGDQAGRDECEKTTIRIVTESIDTSTLDWANTRLDQQLSKTILAYKKSHENVEIVIEQIPGSGGERTATLERIRTELMAGKGPDILLLPGNCLMRDERGALKESLILDVNQAMHNGLFADISEYYDADTELGKENLQSTVMDAGVMDGARYVLPLRYDFPVACVSVERFGETGLSKDIFNTGILDFMKTAVNAEDKTAISMCVYPYEQILENLLPDVIDYNGQQVKITREELAEYCETYWKYSEKRDQSEYTTALTYPNTTELQRYSINGGPFEYQSWLYSDHWMCVESLDRAIHVATLAEFAGVDVEMYPIRAADGKLVADVTYYGAISACCENVDAAYGFLRQLLLEDFQWEQSTDAKSFYIEFAAPGWPVRTKGSVNPLALSLVGQRSFEREDLPLKNALYTVTDEDLPILNAQIDEVRFPIGWYADLQYEIVRTKLRNDKDADALAEKWLKNLEWHLAES